MPETTEPDMVMALSAREVSLLADAVACLWLRDARREECFQFAWNHPELKLFELDLEEPELEDGR